MTKIKTDTYMFMSHHQNAGQNHNLMVANKSFKQCDKVQSYGNDSNKSKFHSI